MLRTSRQEVRMSAPDSTGPHPHDHDNWRLEREPHCQSEPLAEEKGIGGDPAHKCQPEPDRRPVPSTPGELVAMQRRLDQQRLPLPTTCDSRLQQALTLLQAQELTPWETQQIALALLQQLESYHQGVVAELHDTPESTSAQVACWAIDGDRLMHCRRLLESVTLI